MESLNTPGTLDEGFLDSKSQNPSDMTLEDVSSEQYSGLVSASEILLIGNGVSSDANNECMGIGNVAVAVEREGGTEGIESGTAESWMKGASLESDFEGKSLVVPHGTRVQDGEVSAQQVCLVLNKNNEAMLEKTVAEEGMKESDASHLDRLDSARKIEVSGNISLFVKVSGPRNGIIQNDKPNSGKGVSGGDTSDEENMCKENGAFLSINGENKGTNLSESCNSMGEEIKDCPIDTKSKGGKVEEGANINLECKFSVGDIVWVKTKTQSWWPGMIYDPSDQSQDAVKADETDCLPVRCFGIGGNVWCSPSELKSFVENFEQMSKQSNSRSFLSAVQKALDEIGQCVMTDMTCPCILKGSWNTIDVQFSGSAGTKEGNSALEEKTGLLEGNSVTQFDPANFLSLLKYLALEVSMPSILEFTVIQNSLSAFYRAIGHHHLHTNELGGTTNDECNAGDGVIAESSFDGQNGVQNPETAELNMLDTPVDYGLHKSSQTTSGKQSAFLVDQISEQSHEDLTKLSFKDEDVCNKCGSDVAEEGANSCEPAEVRLGSNAAAGQDICNLTSSSGEIHLPVSLAKTYGKVITEGKSEKEYESRERKKSKYLSPPYINLRWGHKSPSMSEDREAEGCKEISHLEVDKKSTAIHSVGSPSIFRCSTKKLKEKQTSKTIPWQNKSGKLEGMDASSAELLTELRSAALDCLYPNQNRDFNKTERFFSGFRRFSFCHESFYEMHRKDTAGHVSNHEIHLFQTSPECEVVMKGKEMEIVYLPNPIGKDLQEMRQPLPDVKPKRRGRKKKEEATIFLRNKHSPGIPDTNKNITTSGSIIIDFQELPCLTPKGKHVLKKTKEAGLTLELPDNNKIAGFQDLNGNRLGQNSLRQVVSPITLQGGKLELKKRKRKDGTASAHSKTENISGLLDVNGNHTTLGSLKDMQVTGRYSLEGVPDVANCEGTRGACSLPLSNELADSLPDVNGNSAEQSSLVNDAQHVELFCSGSKLQPKKRKRKEEISLDSLETDAAPAIPDLNGNDVDSGSLGKDTQEMSKIMVEGKHQQKKSRKSKPAFGIPDFNVNDSNIQDSGDALGNVLLLKFAPGFPMPTNAALVATFCGFGPLNESETQVLNDFCSAQVFFINSYDAGDAIRSLERGSPFGPALVSCQLQHLSVASRSVASDSNSHVPQSFHDIEGLRTAAKASGLKPHHGEAPDLFFIRQNLEMMTSTLEKAGDNLSAEMRANLESEIRGLLKKVSTMVGSSPCS